ncbi:MAG: hypothetical protein RJQ14_04260, partial [Marinoscillum sp.]
MKRFRLIFSFLFSFSVSAFAADLKPLYDDIIIEYRAKNVHSAIEKGATLLETAKLENNEEFLIKTYYLMAFIHSHSDNFGDAIIYYLEGARHAELSSNPDLKANLISMYKNLALILGDYKHYELSHKFINEGLRVAKEQNNTKQIIELLNNRIHELISEEKYQEALIEIEGLENGYDISLEQQIALSNKSGVVYHNLGDTVLAIKNYLQVINNDPDINPGTYSMSLLNLVNIYFEKRQNEQATDYYHQTVDFSLKNELNQRVIRGYQKLGEVLFQLEKYSLALNYFKKGIEYLEEGDISVNSYEIFKEISNTHTALNDYESALKYERIYSVKLEEFIEQQKKIEELDKKYNIQLLTERYFDLLAADQEKKETERLAKFGIGGTSFVFLSILFLMLYKQQRTKLSIEKELTNIE